jgi:NAD(P)-dependent dehydrogenase (short-subunit alcohol dehydrogenase family)
MTSSFSGKVAVVTGAGSGIGRQLALELVRRGARVAACDVSDEGLAETAGLLKDLGAAPHAARLDVSDRQTASSRSRCSGRTARASSASAGSPRRCAARCRRRTSR